MTAWQDIGAAHARHLHAKSTSQRSGPAFEITRRPIMAFPPLSVWLAGVAVWAFVGTVVVFVIVVAG